MTKRERRTRVTGDDLPQRLARRLAEPSESADPRGYCAPQLNYGRHRMPPLPDTRRAAVLVLLYPLPESFCNALFTTLWQVPIFSVCLPEPRLPLLRLELSLGHFSPHLTGVSLFSEVCPY